MNPLKALFSQADNERESKRNLSSGRILWERKREGKRFHWWFKDGGGLWKEVESVLEAENDPSWHPTRKLSPSSMTELYWILPNNLKELENRFFPKAPPN